MLKELDEFLRSQEVQETAVMEWKPLYKNNLDCVEGNLSDGYKFIQHLTCKSLRGYLDYGQYLLYARKVHASSTSDLAWKKWLKERIGIDDSYARKLMKVSSELKEFSRFKNLAVSFHKIYSKLSLIMDMLLDDERRAFWSEL